MYTLFDETFWVAVSITLTLVLIVKYSKDPLTHMLNNRSALISNKIAEAMSLLGEAEKLFNEQKNLHKKYLKEAEDIHKSIEAGITLLKQQAEEDFAVKLSNKTFAIENRIVNQQHNLLYKLRLEAATLAIKTTTLILQKQENIEMNAKILDDAVHAVMAKQL
jgi:F0F1-type ATP synthase membrane subunit b/b'